MKALKITFWIVTSLFSLMLLGGAFAYFFNYDEMAVGFENLNFPTWVIYPYAVLKILGVLAILIRKSSWLKEWAYAGFFFAISMALYGHIHVQDGEQWGALIALVLLITSYILQKRAFPAKV